MNTGKYIGKKAGAALIGLVALLFAEPCAGTERDTQVIKRVFANAVANMTFQGLRHPNSHWNNISAALAMSSAGKFGTFYLGCEAQSKMIADALRQQSYDSSWSFQLHSRNFPLPHKWLVAESSDRSDPLLVLDSWTDRAFVVERSSK